MTSRGFETDRIEAICELICATGHIREMLDDENENLSEIYKQTLELRREEMNRLLEGAENPNPKYWCLVKHLLGAWWRQVEVYEASLSEDDYELAKRLGNLAASALSQYLGMEFENCSRCFFDKILVKQYEKEGLLKLKKEEKENG